MFFAVCPLCSPFLSVHLSSLRLAAAQNMMCSIMLFSPDAIHQVLKSQIPECVLHGLMQRLEYYLITGLSYPQKAFVVLNCKCLLSLFDFCFYFLGLVPFLYHRTNHISCFSFATERITKHTLDTSSVAVCASAIQSITVLLECPHSHAVL